jgi:hypothetical protein
MGRLSLVTVSVACVSLLAPWATWADDGGSDNRIALSVDGATQTPTHGAGVSVGWLHNFDSNSLAGVAFEHQSFADAQWSFGSISGSITRGPDDAHYSLYGGVHEGAGQDGLRAFHYSIVDGGVAGTYFRRLSVQLDDRQIDVETTHGNLPKVGLSYVWTHHLLGSVSHAYSVSGNLGTRLTIARVQYVGAKLNPLAGIAFGRAAPAVLDLQTGVARPSTLKEGYVGLSSPVPQLHGDLLLIIDYLELTGSQRTTLTLSYVFQVGAARSVPP